MFFTIHKGEKRMELDRIFLKKLWNGEKVKEELSKLV